MGHGPFALKSIPGIAGFIKDGVPASIPEGDALKPAVRVVASEEAVWSGVLAYRDFLYRFCDRLASDGDAFFKLPEKPKSATDYPFLHHMTDLLWDIGYRGVLSEDGESLSVTEMPSFFATLDAGGHKQKPKHPVTKLPDYLRFLTLCGFVFAGLDAGGKTLGISALRPLVVTYPGAPALLLGLKAMAIADAELQPRRYKNDEHHDNLLRCDHWLISAEAVDADDVLKDFVRPLPEAVQAFALALHRRAIDKGMTCVMLRSTFESHFAYVNVKNPRADVAPKALFARRVWAFSLSQRDGHSLVVRAKKMDGYPEVIAQFPAALREKIERGYGCDRKLHNAPCRHGCQGFVFPLDESTVMIGGEIETWLDQEA